MIFIYEKTIITPMKDTEYFDSKELTGWNRLVAFNHQTKLFQSLSQAPMYSSWDASGICNGHKVIIELKQRQAILLPDMKLSAKTFVDDNVMVEDYKVALMLLTADNEGFIPLYFNLLDDGSIIVHNLHRLSSWKKFTNLNIESKGYQSNQLRTNRIGLFVKDAVIYNKNGKLIQGKNTKNNDNQ